MLLKTTVGAFLAHDRRGNVAVDFNNGAKVEPPHAPSGRVKFGVEVLGGASDFTQKARHFMGEMALVTGRNLRSASVPARPS